MAGAVPARSPAAPPPLLPAAPVGAKQANRLDLHSPILKPEQMQAMKAMSYKGWETRVS